MNDPGSDANLLYISGAFLVIALLSSLFYLVRVAAFIQSDHRKLIDLLSGSTRSTWGLEIEKMNRRTRSLSLVSLTVLALAPLTLSILYVGLKPSNPQSQQVPSSDSSHIDIPGLDESPPPKNIPIDQVHDFYRGKLEQIRGGYSGLVKQLGEARVHTQSMSNLVAQLDQENSELENAYLNLEQTSEAQKEQLLEAQEIQSQLVNELSIAQQNISQLSVELQAAKGLLTDTLIDIEVALEKAGPPLDDLVPGRLRDADAILQQAGGVRRRLEQVTEELKTMQNRLRPQPVEILELQENNNQP